MGQRIVTYRNISVRLLLRTGYGEISPKGSVNFVYNGQQIECEISLGAQHFCGTKIYTEISASAQILCYAKIPIHIGGVIMYGVVKRTSITTVLVVRTL